MLRSVQADDEQDGLVWQYDDPENPDLRGNGTRMHMKRLIIKMVKSPKFFYFGGLLVLLDTAFMCVRSVHASEKSLEMLGKIS